VCVAVVFLCSIGNVDDADDDADVMLPCEFCEELLPSSQLAFHQVSTLLLAFYCFFSMLIYVASLVIIIIIIIIINDAEIIAKLS